MKCEYPRCNEKSEYMQSFELIDEEGANVEIPFCPYHYYIVMGGHFKAKIRETNEEDPVFELVGPFKEVEIAMQVVAAREMIIKLKSDDKSLKKK